MTRRGACHGRCPTRRELPKKKITHEMGQDLALLSVGELAERIGLLKDEIGRLEAEMARKHASKSAADMFFQEIAMRVSTVIVQRGHQARVIELNLQKDPASFCRFLNLSLSFLVHYR